ncbi:MAG: hypothetical protein ACTHKL_30010 [Streptosporangiaceae bacterium]
MAPLPPNPALKQLQSLIGDWTVEVPQFPGEHGRATFEWLEGGAYLRFHAETPDPAPDATLIISRDESGDIYTVLHYDSRGVSRVYQMTLDDRTWKIWRNVPGFFQRFVGTLSQDGRTIRAAWQKSPDGKSWEHDFDLIYTRI